MRRDNLALSTTRNVETEGFSHAFVVDRLTTHHTVSVKEVNYAFPLNIYPDPAAHDLFSHPEAVGGPQPNLHPKVVSTLAEAHGQQPTPEEIFHFVYAILHAPSYRAKYADFLKTDFPRIPFSRDRELFRTLAGLGRRLVELHLLRSPELDPPAARFHGAGDNRVAKNARQGLRYAPEGGRAWINESQHFAPVPPEVWEYVIGGYQVLEKWLKDRRGRHLSLTEIQIYCRIATALDRTLEIQEEIDALYGGVEEGVVEVG
jgi:predicted helicase